MVLDLMGRRTDGSRSDGKGLMVLDLVVRGTDGSRSVGKRD